MRRPAQALLVGALLCLTQTVRADVTVTTSVGLTSLQILPSAGTVEAITPWPASVSAQATDSLGGSDTELDIVVGDDTSISASTALAYAFGSASALTITASGSSGIVIPNIAASAASEGFGQIAGIFEITGTDSPVDVEISAVLNITQSLATGVGQWATSEAIFDLEMPGLGGSILFFDNPHSIGPGESVDFSSSPTLSQTVTLDPDTQYLFIAGADAKSSGTSSLPEPSLFLLSSVGLVALAAAVIGRRRRNAR